MSLYLDSAYIAKCYVNEPDADNVRRLVQGQQELHSSAWCLAEMACVLHRHLRQGHLSRETTLRLHERFLRHVDKGLWTLWPVSEVLLRRVEAAIRALPANVYLRAGDAVHLVSAREAGFAEIWTNDRHLLKAAPHFGLRGRSV